MSPQARLWIFAAIVLFGAMPTLAAKNLDSGTQSVDSGTQSVEVVSGPGGYVSVTETGHPPVGMVGALGKAIARENALARARHRLLKALMALETAKGRKLEDVLRKQPELRTQLRALLKNANQRRSELAGDVVEITLTIPFEGEHGLAKYLDGVP